MNEGDYGILKMRVHEESTASQGRRVAGGDLYGENTRYSYLIGQGRVSFSEAQTQRMVNESGSGRPRALDLEPLPLAGEQQGEPRQ